MAKRGKKKRRGAKRAAAGARGGRGSTLRGVPTSELQAELERRAQDLGRLEAKHDELMAQVQDVEAEIATISAALGAGGGGGGRGRKAGRRGKRGRPGRPGRPGRAPGAGRARGAGGGRKRPRNPESLEMALAKALKGKTLGVTEAADAVQKAGYKTSSPNFRTIVNQALLRSDLIKKVGRGAYTAA